MKFSAGLDETSAVKQSCHMPFRRGSTPSWWLRCRMSQQPTIVGAGGFIGGHRIADKGNRRVMEKATMSTPVKLPLAAGRPAPHLQATS
jgi:hypothetical protein